MALAQPQRYEVFLAPWIRAQLLSDIRQSLLQGREDFNGLIFGKTCTERNCSPANLALQSLRIVFRALHPF